MNFWDDFTHYGDPMRELASKPGTASKAGNPCAECGYRWTKDGERGHCYFWQLEPENCNRFKPEYDFSKVALDVASALTQGVKP